MAQFVTVLINIELSTDMSETCESEKELAIGLIFRGISNEIHDNLASVLPAPHQREHHILSDATPWIHIEGGRAFPASSRVFFLGDDSSAPTTRAPYD